MVFQNNEMVAMLVAKTIPVGVELFSYANTFLCSNKFAQMWYVWYVNENALFPFVSTFMPCYHTRYSAYFNFSVSFDIVWSIRAKRNVWFSAKNVRHLENFKIPKFQSGLKPVFITKRFPPQDCGS